MVTDIRTHTLRTGWLGGAVARRNSNRRAAERRRSTCSPAAWRYLDRYTHISIDGRHISTWAVWTAFGGESADTYRRYIHQDVGLCCERTAGGDESPASAARTGTHDITRGFFRGDVGLLVRGGRRRRRDEEEEEEKKEDKPSADALRTTRYVSTHICRPD